ncbi:MAG: hypothetical protein KDE47_23450, partial [Caldilineaceae bacterium]|nr:hypothetical protein [Caldilineaceae bacterium]
MINLNTIQFKSNDIQHVLIFLCTVLFGIALYIASLHTGTGAYEISIYAEYPQIFWFILLGIGTIGTAICYSNIFTSKPTYAWIYGVLFTALIAV